MKKLLKLGLVVPAVLALGFGFAAFAADNSDNNSDLNRDLNEKGTVTRESQKASASDSNPSDGSGTEANTTAGNTADDRQIIDRRGRTPGKTALTNAAGQDRWWWGGQHHNGGSSNGTTGNTDEDEDADEEEGPNEEPETETVP